MIVFIVMTPLLVSLAMAGRLLGTAWLTLGHITAHFVLQIRLFSLKPDLSFVAPGVAMIMILGVALGRRTGGVSQHGWK